LGPHFKVDFSGIFGRGFSKSRFGESAVDGSVIPPRIAQRWLSSDLYRTPICMPRMAQECRRWLRDTSENSSAMPQVDGSVIPPRIAQQCLRSMAP
jgi:hypothetical protein